MNDTMMIRNPETNEWESVYLPPGGDTYPIGAYAFIAGEKAPTGWLRCDGQAVSRTEYADLFNAIGTTYGAGDGATTFNLPNVNLANRTLVGSSGDGEFSPGNTMGEKEHTLTIDEIPKHNHDLKWDFEGATGSGHGTLMKPGSDDTNYLYQTADKGGNQPHNNMQPSIAAICIIKAKQSVGIVGSVTDDINDTNDNAVANAKTVKEYVDNKEKKFELWRNPNPTGTIANNVTFTFDSQEDYDELEVLYKRTNTQNYIFSTGRLPKGYNISLDCQGTSADNYAWIRSRNLTRVNDYSYTHLYPSIQYTNSNVSTTENGACIPIVIYGYKYEV